MASIGPDTTVDVVCVDHGNVKVARDQGACLIRGARDRKHGTGLATVHQAGAGRDDLGCSVEIKNAGDAGGGVLADRMADHPLWRHAPAHPQPGKCVFDGEQRGLRIDRLAQLFGCCLLVTSGWEDETCKVDIDVTRERLAALIERVTEYGFVFVKAAAHAGVLGALAGEHEAWARRPR